MSAIAGIYCLDGAPVDGQQLISLAERLRGRGPDGGSTITFTSIGMVYRAFHTNGESRLEKQPLVSRDRQVLAWDGRLDNRADLISTLIDELNGDHTDVAIVMAAYRKWPTDFLERLIADFALCL